ncbi:MAG: hypothetical protein JEZ03_10910 [Bacteroidales bacterium]|nr:hypothetical protein [Bacteroidales bacterium]
MKEQDLNEELRQYKLFRIQQTEEKLNRFQEVYEDIKQSIVIKISKNIGSNIIKYMVFIIAVLLMVLGIVCHFPEAIVNSMEPDGVGFSYQEKEDLETMIPYFTFVFYGFAALFLFIAWLIKLNTHKRNSLYGVSTLLSEVMTYMETSNKEEKQKYEYFVDAIHERQKMEEEKASGN